jgi:hypothetical protein
MPLPQGLIEAILKITKATKRELNVFGWLVGIFIIVWLVRVIIIGKDDVIKIKDEDCAKNYNRLEKLYNITEMDKKYISQDKSKLLILNDSLYQVIFKLKRKLSECEQKLPLK